MANKNDEKAKETKKKTTKTAKRKKVAKKISYYVKPEKMTLEEWQVALRRQVAREERFSCRVMDDELKPGEYIVENAKKQAYKVVYRGAKSAWNYCSCMDFKTSGLGTCKHLEALKMWLGSHKHYRVHREQPPYTSVYLSYTNSRQVRIRIGEEHREEYEALASRFFDNDGVMTARGFKDYAQLLIEGSRISDSFRFYDDAIDFIVEQRERHLREKLIAGYTDADLKAWSHQMVEEKGMPAYPESDALPNLSALGYGYYPMSGNAIAIALASVTSLEKPYERLSTLANLYENMLHGRLTPEQLLPCLEEVLRKEKDPLVASSALGYLGEVWRHCPAEVEALLHGLAKSGDIPAQVRLSAFRSLVHLHRDATVDEELWQVWLRQQPLPGLQLSAEDYNTLACELALRRPADRERIRQVQRSRISNADRLARFDYVWPSLSPDKAVRDSVFLSLLEPGNRATEPWALESLRLLNHPLLQQEALGYIVPALDEMQEIQRTGDIFFPKNWITATLSGHDSPEAATLVRDWLDAHPDYPTLLLNKILQAADPLLFDSFPIGGRPCRR